MDKGFYSPKPGKPADCFSTSMHNAEFFSGQHNYQMIITVVGHKTAKDLRPFYDAVAAPKEKANHPLRIEAEVVFSGNTRFIVLGKQTTRKGKDSIIVEYIVKEEGCD